MSVSGPHRLEGRPLVEDGLELRIAPLGGHANPDHLVIVKSEEEIEAYRDLFTRFDRPKMVELGIAYGGSVAFHALAAKPEKLVAVELSADRVPLLDRVLAARNLADSVRLHYGIDQGTRSTLERIIAEEFGDCELDLVVDDASHRYEPTVVSFDLLFPRLRPGGLFVLEDWSCDEQILLLLQAGLVDASSGLHPWARGVVEGSGATDETAQTRVAAQWLAGTLPDAERPVPLSRLTAQLGLAASCERAGIAKVVITDQWVVVERSAVALDRQTYSITDPSLDPFHTMAATAGAAPSPSA